jgi:hypothetical protein
MAERKKHTLKISQKTQEAVQSQCLLDLEESEKLRYKFMIEQKALIDFLGGSIARTIEDLVRVGDEYQRRVIELQKLSVEVMASANRSRNTVN